MTLKDMWKEMDEGNIVPLLNIKAEQNGARLFFFDFSRVVRGVSHNSDNMRCITVSADQTF